MHGLQTIQKINDAQVAFRRDRVKTKVGDVIEGFFVFYPNGYEVVYDTVDALSEDRVPTLTIEFKGEDSTGARFDVRTAAPNAVGHYINRSLAEVVQFAESVGIPGDDVSGRLGRLFVTINKS